NVINDTVSYPAYAGVTTTGQASYTWAASTADVRGLQKGAAPDRIAATWYGNSFSIDVNLTDGAAHPLALYLVDWDSTVRTEEIDLRDGANGALLDSRLVSGFHGGQYMKWTVQSHVKLTVIWASGPNAVVSGVFFGMN